MLLKTIIDRSFQLIYVARTTFMLVSFLLYHTQQAMYVANPHGRNADIILCTSSTNERLR